MPAIIDTRVSNVRYENDKRFIDDMTIPANGGSLLMEFLNGGGKTLYSQCWVQSILPNSYFIPVNNIRRLFDENSNEVIHSATAWELDEGDEYKYLILGFCAKRISKKEEGCDGSFKYFNYAILYNEDTYIDISSLPFKNENNGIVSRATWSSMRNYVNKLSNELDCFTCIFDNKTEYGNFLFNYNINQEEWKLMCSINATEGGSEQFFTEYKKGWIFIEKYLVPMIEGIERCKVGSDINSSKDLAKDLLKMKDSFNELSIKKNRIKDLDLARNTLNEIVNINENISKELKNEEAIKLNIIKGYNKQLSLVEDAYADKRMLERDLDESNKTIENLNEKIDNSNEAKKNNDIKIEENALQIENINEIKRALIARAEYQRVESVIEGINSKIELSSLNKNTLEVNKLNLKEEENKLNSKIELKRMENTYLECVNDKNAINKRKFQIDNTKKNHSELFKEKNVAEGMYCYLLKKNEQELKNGLDALKGHIVECNNEMRRISEEILDNRSALDKNNYEVEGLNERISKKKSNIENYEVEVLNEKDFKLDCIEKIKLIVSKIEGLLEKFVGLQGFNEEEAKELVKLIKVCITKKNIEFGLLEAISRFNDFIRDFENNLTEARVKVECDRDELLRDELKKIECANIDKKEIAILKIDKEVEALSKEKVELSNSYKTTSSLISGIEEILLEYEDDEEIVTELVRNYTKGSVFGAESIIKDSLESDKRSLFNLDIQIQSISKELKDLLDNKKVSLNKDVENTYSIITKIYSSAILGRDYIESLEDKDKEFILNKGTIIAEGIILKDKEYKSFINNKSLLKKIDVNMVPVINIDKIKHQCSVLNPEIIFFNTKDKDVFLDREIIEKKILELKGDKLKLENQKDNLLNLINEKEGHLNKVVVFNSKYNDKFEEQKKLELKEHGQELNQNNAEIEKINKSLDDLNIEKANLKNAVLVIKSKVEIHENERLCRLESLNKELITLSDISKVIVTIDREVEIVDEWYKKVCVSVDNIINLNNKIKQSREFIGINEKRVSEFAVVNQEIMNNIDTLKGLENKKYTKKIDLEKKVQDKKSDLNKFVEILNGMSSQIVEIENNLSLDELKGKIEVYNSKIGGEAYRIEVIEDEIRQIVRSYERKLSQIKNSNVTLDYLETRNSEITYNDEEVFKCFRKEIEEIHKRIDLVDKSREAVLVEIASYKSELKEKVSKLKKINTREDLVVPDGYDVEKEMELARRNLEELKKKKSELDDIEKKYRDMYKSEGARLKELTDNISKKTIEFNKLCNLRNDTKILIDKHFIDVNITNELALDTEFVENKAKSSLEVSIAKLEKLKTKHTVLRDDGYESLKESPFEFKDSLKRITPPDSLSECINQYESIKGEPGFIYYIDQTKYSIEGELSGIKEMKNIFISKCIDRVLLLANKLQEISRYTTVSVNGKKIPLLKVKLDLLKEDERIEKMTRYIDYMLECADSKNDRRQKEELLEMGLHLSKLLDKVVTSIYECNVMLYIPDNIKVEEGSYCKWNGGSSGGQRSASYFTVTIALIIYMRESSRMNSNVKSIKPLYADGVFRSVNSVYLWELITKLIEENDIQLISTDCGVKPKLRQLFESIAYIEESYSTFDSKRYRVPTITVESKFKKKNRTLVGDSILNRFGEVRRSSKKYKQENEKSFDIIKQGTLFDL